MDKIISRLKSGELRMLIWANRRAYGTRRHRFSHRWFSSITHMGGATFTLSTALLFALLAPGAWASVGWKCLLAVVISHIPVAIVKRKFRRLRPYQAIPEMNIGSRPLEDPSFPSGHTTAIFAWTVPIMLTAAGSWNLLVTPLGLLIACSVGWSRMYLGLHYPSDVAAGAFVGTLSAFAVQFFWIVPAAV